MVSSVANNAYTGSAATSSTDTADKEVPVLCTVSNGTDAYGNPTYPSGCSSTLSFPRYALAGGGRLFVADGGNDRVLVFNNIPKANKPSADVILGQIGDQVDQSSDATNSLETPSSMAWDGTNLFVSDTYNDRISVFSVGTNNVQYQAVRNAASFNITANGAIAIGGTIQAGDVATIAINGVNYTYTVQATDTLQSIVSSIAALLNNANNGAGDPNLVAVADTLNLVVNLTAKLPGELGNNVAYSVAVTAAASATSADLAATAEGGYLTGGGGAANVAPGTLVSIIGTGSPPTPWAPI